MIPIRHRTLRGGAASLAVASALILVGCLPAGARGERLRERIQEKRGGADGSSEVKHDIVYTHASDRDIALDLYLPQGSSPHPIAVFVHGGGWTGGGKAMGQLICSALAARGYLAASIDYRLAEVAQWPAQINDCQAAVTWLQEHGTDYGGDPTQLVVMGGSAGGQLVLSLACGWGAAGGTVVDGVPQEARWPDRPIKACCSWFGPSDLTELVKAPQAPSNIKLYLGENRQERMLNAAQASPILYADSGDSPVLFVHGTADELVPMAQSVNMQQALNAVGVSTKLIKVEGGGHGGELASREELRKLVAQMIDWLDEQLGRSSS